MSNEKRARQRAQREERLQKEAQAAKSSRKLRLGARWVGIIVAVLVVAFAYSVIAGEDSAETANEEISDQVLSAGAIALGIGDCPQIDGSSPIVNNFDSPPKLCINPEKLYAADFVTSSGSFSAVLNPKLDIKSVNNFIVLAQYHAYDGTLFHRVIDEFVIQGGDVENNFGTGGPGYQFNGSYAPQGSYRIGSLAMANSGTPSSNGSQFFIITGPNGINLPADYSLMGSVIAGLDVALAIQKVPTSTKEVAGISTSNVPLEDVVIESITTRLASQDETKIYRNLE